MKRIVVGMRYAGNREGIDEDGEWRHIWVVTLNCGHEYVLQQKKQPSNQHECTDCPVVPVNPDDE